MVLRDKTNIANISNTMKRKQTQKSSVKNSVKRRPNTSKDVALNLNLTTNNRGKPKHKTVVNETKTTRKSDVEKSLKNKQKTQPQQQNKVKLQESLHTQKLNVKRRSSRLSNEENIRTSKSNKDKLELKSSKNISKTNKDASKFESNLQNDNQPNEELKAVNKTNKTIKSNKQNIKTPPLKTKRLLECLKSPSPENSDPYEFKFDPKKEPKPKPKKRGKRKKFHIPTDSSDDEDNSMKPVIKNIRKRIEIKQKIHVTPVERKLRNRLVRIENQVGLVPQKNENTTNKTCDKKINDIEINPTVKTGLVPQKNKNKTCDKKINDIIEINPTVKTGLVPQKNKNKTCDRKTNDIDINPTVKTGLVPQKNENKTNKTCDKIPQNTNDSIEINPTVKDTSIVDEINEIANTFLEDDDCNNDSNVSMSTPSRIDIISQLIARKPNPKQHTNVFNSTMIHDSPQQMAPRSPWRVEVSTIPRKSLNFSVKNASFTPSYTSDIITDNKKQTTLLDFVNRTSKTDLPVTLFQNSPTRKPFENLSSSMSPIRSNNSNVSPVKRGDDSLFGFTVLSDSEDKENSSVFAKIAKKQNLKRPKIKQKKQTHEVKINETAPVIDDDISIALFEDLEEKRNEKRYSRQYTRPQIKRKRNVSYNICSDDSDSETEILPVLKKQKDVLTKEEAEEAERLASHYNSYFDEIENYPLCIE